MGNLQFKASDYTGPAPSWKPLPAGMYLAKIVSSEEKETKSGTGSYFNLRFQIIGKEGNGRNLFHMLNIKNKSEKAMEIAKGQLNEIMRACGLDEIKDTAQLHERPMLIKLKVEFDNYKNEEVNKIVGWKARNPSVDVAVETKAEAVAKVAAAIPGTTVVEKDDVPF